MREYDEMYKYYLLKVKLNIDKVLSKQ